MNTTHFTQEEFESFISSFVSRSIGNEEFLVPLTIRPTHIHKLNQSAAVLWKLASKLKNYQALVKAYSQYYNLEDDTATSDIQHLYTLLHTETKNTVSSDLSSSNALHSTDHLTAITWELTGNCNLKCKHCYAASLRNIPPLDGRTCIRIIDELYDLGCLYITFTGGECTLHPKFKELYEYARKKGFCVSILTNATTIQDLDLLPVFLKYPPYQIKVSLYGATATEHDQLTQVHGSYQKTIRNVTALVNQQTFVWFSGLVTSSNQDQLEEMQTLAKQVGTQVFFYNSFIPTRSGDCKPLQYKASVSKEIIQSLNKSFTFKSERKQIVREKNETEYPCLAGKTSCHLDASGRLSLCMMEQTNRISVFPSLITAWNQLVQIQPQLVALPKSCISCESKTKCRICPTKITYCQMADKSYKLCNNIVNYCDS